MGKENSSNVGHKSKILNAFDVLMNKGSLARVSSKRRRLSSSCWQGMDGNGVEESSGISTGNITQSRFVDCPICLKRIPLATVDFHADQCLDQTTMDLRQAATVEAKDNDCVRVEKSTVDDSRTPLQKNALQHLMYQSKLLSRPPLQQRFHLHSDLTVTWDNVIQDGDATLTAVEAVASLDDRNSPTVHWSAIILLDTSHSSPQEEGERLIELIVSSSVPSSSTAPKPFMSKLSKLSIPVLKSMIQKSIRRQRPQQATMLAMELSDKSWSDLLRRIPIIMFEDAALHPDLPLLVWLMVADSKNFVVNSTIADRVMSIVFELAACPWRDKVTEQMDEKNIELSINKDILLRELDIQNQTIIKSMLLRAKYGGMMCDVIMMKNFASIWMYRFQNESKSNNSFCHGVTVKDNIGFLSSNTSYQLCAHNGKHMIPWSSLPLVLYRQFRKEYEQYAKNEARIAEEEGRTLRWDDLCKEGIDFHCSNVLDIVLKDHKATLLSFLDHQEKVRTKPEEESLRSMCQKAMWIHSSGVNVKQYLLQDDLEEINQQASCSNRALLLSLWNVMKPHIDQFCRQYLLFRISPP